MKISNEAKELLLVAINELSQAGEFSLEVSGFSMDDILAAVEYIETVGDYKIARIALEKVSSSQNN